MARKKIAAPWTCRLSPLESGYWIAVVFEGPESAGNWKYQCQGGDAKDAARTAGFWLRARLDLAPGQPLPWDICQSNTPRRIARAV